MYSTVLFFVNRSLRRDIDKALAQSSVEKVLLRDAITKDYNDKINVLNKQIKYYKKHMPELGSNFQFETAYPYDKKPETVI